MHRTRSVWLGLLGFVALSSMTPLARAQNPAAAEVLFEEARAAMSAGSYDIACARFRDSDKLDPAVGTRFNLADCEERRGRVATAWSSFRGVAAELGPDDDRKPIAEERAKALEPRLPYLTLQRTSMTPAGVRVLLDGVELGEASIGVALPMDPGTHQLVLLSGSGGEQQRSSFTLREGQHTSLPVRVFVKPAAPPAELEPASSQRDASGSLSTRRVWMIVAGGVGLAGVTAGAVTGVITLDKKSTANRNCDDALQLCNQTGADANRSGKAFAVASSVSFGVGIAGLATAAYLWLTEPQPAPQVAHSSTPVRRERRVSLEPQLDWVTSSGFVSLSGCF